MFGRTSETDNNHKSSSNESFSVGSQKPINLDQPGEIIAFVGEGVTFKGTIRYKGTVRIDGRVDGEIHTDGVLIIGEKAVISAKVEAGAIICQGHITGDIIAQDKVKLISPAVFEGSVKAPSLSMDEGVLFNGTCQMQKNGEPQKTKDASYFGSVEETLNVG